MWQWNAGNMLHWRAVEQLAAAGVDIKVTYDNDYGDDRKKGWTVCIEKVNHAQFQPDAATAIITALVNHITYTKGNT